MKRIRGLSSGVQQVADTLRHELTPAERILWNALRGKRLAGLGFRRQHPVGRFVLDFYLPSHHLVVELDGAGHEEQRERDAERTAWLTAYGYRVLRFGNEEVLSNLSGVLEQIRRTARESSLKRFQDAPDEE
jgi:very-short-patch-repair endonuclease